MLDFQFKALVDSDCIEHYMKANVGNMFRFILRTIKPRIFCKYYFWRKLAWRDLLGIVDCLYMPMAESFMEHLISYLHGNMIMLHVPTINLHMYPTILTVISLMSNWVSSFISLSYV